MHSDALADIGYQPIVDLFSGRVPAHEVSLGWGSLPPAAPGVDPDALRALRLLDLAAGLPTPLHLPLHAGALLRDAGLPDLLAQRCAETRRAPDTVTIQLAERDCMVDVVSLRRRCAALRRHGFAIGIDEVGAYHGSLSVLASIHPQVIKLHRTVVSAVGEYPEATALVEAVVLFARKLGATLMAAGVDSAATVSTLRSLGVGYGQGAFFGEPDSAWSDVVSVPPLLAQDQPLKAADEEEPGEAQTLRELLRRAMVAPADSSGDEIRDLFGMDEDLLTVILIDEAGKVAGVIPRGTFMLAASGPFGHALHARRGVLQHAVRPKLMGPDTPVSDAIRMVTSRSRSRVYDDIVVADRTGRCVGIVRVADLLTAVQRNQVDVAISLDPLTELPSGKVVEDNVRRRVREPGGAAISWIEVDRQAVLEADGFLAGNALVVESAAVLRRVASYIGGSWLGHFGSGAFVLLTDRMAAERAIRSLLESRPEDRYGRPVDLTIGTLDCPPTAGADAAGLSERLAELMRHAHALGGTAWVAATHGEPGVRVQYASRPVLSASSDFSQA
ncbi:EAL domain-containing protein [Cryptosporangium phraense]|uniref:EAL domain-containing protein n=1 Tax=Cryptosporangium phraense TaxID=2593070 RepID=A0A545AHB5_9ACTN|nr:EAL domain-containing protein [Cryptosporangium phraense]TQS40709.1 EAL domain-containing protein [Cryptosporangium phraense]